MSEQVFLTRAEVDLLATKLEHVPDIEAALALALSGQSARVDSEGRAAPASRPPYPVHLEDVRDELCNELSTTIRLLIEERGLSFDGGQSLAAYAAWLTRNRTALQLVDAGVECFNAICARIDATRRVLGHRDAMLVTEAQVEAANRQWLTASQVEQVARRLGERGHGLNRQRLWRLVEAGKVKPSGSGEPVFQLGDVLAAHETTPRRLRRHV